MKNRTTGTKSHNQSTQKSKAAVTTTCFQATKETQYVSSAITVTFTDEELWELECRADETEQSVFELASGQLRKGLDDVVLTGADYSEMAIAQEESKKPPVQITLPLDADGFARLAKLTKARGCGDEEMVRGLLGFDADKQKDGGTHRAKVSLVLPRDVAICFSKARQKHFKNSVALRGVEVCPTSISSQRHPDKVKVNVWVPYSAATELARLNKLTGHTKTDILIGALAVATQDIFLTRSDLDKIKRDTAKARTFKGDLADSSSRS